MNPADPPADSDAAIAADPSYGLGPVEDDENAPPIAVADVLVDGSDYYVVRRFASDGRPIRESMTLAQVLAFAESVPGSPEGLKVRVSRTGDALAGGGDGPDRGPDAGGVRGGRDRLPHPVRRARRRHDRIGRSSRGLRTQRGGTVGAGKVTDGRSVPPASRVPTHAGNPSGSTAPHSPVPPGTVANRPPRRSSAWAAVTATTGRPNRSNGRESSSGNVSAVTAPGVDGLFNTEAPDPGADEGVHRRRRSQRDGNIAAEAADVKPAAAFDMKFHPVAVERGQFQAAHRDRAGL